MMEEGGSQGPWKEARGEKMITNHNGEEDRSGMAESLSQEYNVFVKLPQEGFTFDEWSQIQLTKALHKEFGEVRSAKKLRNGCLMITCKDKQQQKKCSQGK